MLYWKIQKVRADRYVHRINPQLESHPVYHKVSASKTLKGPIMISFSGAVGSEAELAALKHFITNTHPPEPYTVPVFVSQ